jgi:tetratricopeptide (TPR) repeat protein
VQIIDGRTGYQTWSQSYNRTANDILDIQQEIARAIVAEITGAGEAPALTTDDITAYDKLLLARHYEQEVRDAQEVDEAKLAKAIDLYRAAVAADPSSALAHSRLAGALLYAGDADAAEPEIFRALSLDPNLSEVQYTLGIFYYARSLPGVHTAYSRAIDLNPNNADALADYAFYEWGHTFAPIEDIETAYRRALDLDPMSLIRYAKLGYFFGVTGQRDKALAIVAKMSDRFTGANVYSSIAQILEQTGDFDLAIAAAKHALSLRPSDEIARAQIAELYAEIGDFDNAAIYEPDPGLGQLFWRRDYPALISLAEERAIDQPEEAELWYLLGFAYGVVGDYANAVRVMNIVGLPDGADDESHVGGDQEGMATLASALAASGKTEDANAVAETTVALMQKFIDSGVDHGVWANTLKSCSLAVLGRDDEAMAAFAHVTVGPGLPRFPWLMDYPCFKRFSSDKRYERVIADVEKRRAVLRGKVAQMDASPGD